MNPVATATMGVALMSSATAGYAHNAIPAHRQPSAAKTLVSDFMPGPSIFVHISAVPVEVTPELGRVIHSAMLASFEHQYYL